MTTLRTDSFLLRGKAGLLALLAVLSIAATAAGAEETFSPPPISAPDGFVVELAAAPPLVAHPMMAGFDDRGRLFIAESAGENLKREDLEKFAPIEALFWQAVDRKLLRDSEMDVLNFLGAAVRARFGNARDPVRVFVAIVRRGLWNHITCEEEDRARAALARHREHFPEAFRVRPGRDLEGELRRAA